GVLLNDAVTTLTISGISNGTGAVTLTNTGAIVQTGAITGGLLTTTATGGTDLSTVVNAVTGFNATNSGSRDVKPTDNASTLNITGISTAVGNVTLFNTGAIPQSGSAISGNVLTTTSGTGTDLSTVTNVVNTFNAANSTSGAIRLKDNIGTLTVSSVAQAAGG